ncbi:hypothetical protein AAF712_016808 [Marasmius tenuissimus]|uniref:Uncharacterized protein n=1 Tax=Marasmius tenuissimus TaxID=585030 RepID=A0ABR2Z5T4_9AGAR
MPGEGRNDTGLVSQKPLAQNSKPLQSSFLTQSFSASLSLTDEPRVEDASIHTLITPPATPYEPDFSLFPASPDDVSRLPSLAGDKSSSPSLSPLSDDFQPAHASSSISEFSFCVAHSELPETMQTTSHQPPQIFKFSSNSGMPSKQSQYHYRPRGVKRKRPDLAEVTTRKLKKVNEHLRRIQEDFTLGEFLKFLFWYQGGDGSDLREPSHRMSVSMFLHIRKTVGFA